MRNKLNKKSQSGILVAVFSVIFLASSVFLATNGTINGSAVSDIQFENFIDKSINIEIWANTSINLEIINNSINALLTFDNQTMLSEQEIEFYLNENLIVKEITNSEGYARTSFDFNKIGSENYFLKAEFQGNSILYLNPSSIIIENFMLNEENQTLLNETNITVENISLENFVCEEFTEQVLWSSGYSLLPPGSLNYETWYPKHNCTELGVSDCFIEKIKIKTRFLYFGEDNEQGEGYIQISNPDYSICNNPKGGNYSQYLASETLIGEDKKMEDYCGGKQDCEIETFENYGDSVCYGIKIYGDQYMITDVFEVTYDLCYEIRGGIK